MIIGKTVKDEVKKIVLSYLKKEFEPEIKEVKAKVQNKIDRAMMKVYFNMMFFAGAILLLIGLALLIDTLTTFPKGTGFVIIGLITTLIAFIAKNL